MSGSQTSHPLRVWREKQGLTLQQAADKLGTSRQVWWGWEHGRRRPSAEFMARVRELTQGAVTADHFFPPVSDAA